MQPSAPNYNVGSKPPRFKIKIPHIFIGWWTVIGGGMLALWGHGYNAYGISAMFKPISEELHFSRAQTSIASSIGRLEGGIEGPITGWITDRFGARWVVFSGVLIMSIALVLMGFINSLWQFLVVWGIMMGTGANIALTLPIDTTISNWFVKKRGTALSIKWIFSGVSGVLIMPMIAWITTQPQYGWRDACTFGGIIMAAVGLPIAWFSFRPHRPEYYGLLPDGAHIADVDKLDKQKVIERGVQYASEVKEVEFTLKQAIKTRTFWLLILVGSVAGLVAPVMSIHCIPFLTDKSTFPGAENAMDPVKAAAMMSLWITASLPMRFVGGFVADRLKSNHLRFLTATAYFLQAAGVLLFLKFKTVEIVYAWFILYGFGQGINITAQGMIRARYFGRKAIGSIQGVSQMIQTPIGIIAPIYAGWIYDTTGSYSTAFAQFAALLVIATVIAIFILPPKPPEKITAINQIV